MHTARCEIISCSMNRGIPRRTTCFLLSGKVFQNMAWMRLVKQRTRLVQSGLLKLWIRMIHVRSGCSYGVGRMYWPRHSGKSRMKDLLKSWKALFLNCVCIRFQIKIIVDLGSEKHFLTCFILPARAFTQVVLITLAPGVG